MNINGVPLLIAEKQEIKGQPAPLLIFAHGYTSAKEHNLHFAYSLAEKGFRVVLPDAPLHGEREPEDITKRDMKFWDIVLQAVDEINHIAAYFSEKDLVIAGKIAAGGISMGAITTYAVLSQNSEIAAGIALMGTPALEDFAKWQVEQLKNRGWTVPFTENMLQDVYYTLRSMDVTVNPELLNQRSLFMWHSKCDEVIPFHHTHSFYEQLQNTDYKGNIMFKEDSASGHKVSRSAYLRSIDWLEELFA
jgi:fermentation-respiration switch protein FrsA (DUF1100 family)